MQAALFEWEAPPAPAKWVEGKQDAMPQSVLAPCFGCGRYVLVRPGLCYGCSRERGFDPNSVPPRPDERVPEGADPGREERIRRYAARAKKRLPLFTDGTEPAPVKRKRVQLVLFEAGDPAPVQGEAEAA